MRLRLAPLCLLGTPALAAAGDVPDDARPPARVEYAQVTIHERVMIRIRPSRAFAIREGRAVDATPVWSEKKAQKCVPVRDLAGAAVSRGGDVDLMLVDGRRLRAKLADDCPSLDFYQGFYLKPAADGRICGGRDVLRARSGAACPIAKFRRLEARR